MFSIKDHFILAQSPCKLYSHAWIWQNSHAWIWQNSPLKGLSSKLVHYLGDLYFSDIYEDLPNKFDFSERQLAIFQCLGVTHTHDFLFATPTLGLGQHMTSMEYHMILFT